jgi:hypothetical protein
MRRIYLVLAIAAVMAAMAAVSALPAFADEEDECNAIPLGPGEYGAAICLTDEELDLYR